MRYCMSSTLLSEVGWMVDYLSGVPDDHHHGTVAGWSVKCIRARSTTWNVKVDSRCVQRTEAIRFAGGRNIKPHVDISNNDVNSTT